MSTLPLTEAILLEIHQSLGCQPSYQTKKKDKFATGQDSFETHKAMVTVVLQAIFDALDMDPQAREDAIGNLMEFGNAYKELELNTWTFAADERQILWMLLGYFYMPSLARRAAFWSIDSPLDKGMPGGRFWYLPEPRELDGKPGLYLPVAQVVDWLLDLLGMPLEEFADYHSESSGGIYEGLRRSLYNWRKATTIRPDSFRKYFKDDTELDFRGAFSLDNSHSLVEQFTAALDFVAHKQLNADKLRQELPMTQPGLLESILDGHADESEQATFIECLAERYSAPSPRTIRQRLLFARMVQDGYVRLLKLLCPGVDIQSADASQNKLLQLIGIYQLTYNLTIDAWFHCKDHGEDAENAWFEEHLPQMDKYGLFLSILPSRRKTANLDLAQLLTRHFYDIPAGAVLGDLVALNENSAIPINKRKAERITTIVNELSAEQHLIERMKTSSPWRALQDEHRYWVISQVAQHSDLSPRSKEAAIQRLRELASTPAETVQAILLELDTYLNGERKQRPKDTRVRVQTLLGEAESSEGDVLWKAAILQYKAKHLLACNDLKGAGKLFREALEAGRERNYGPLRGEVARNCLAVEVANQKLIKNNHEKYYRELLAGGIVEGTEIPGIEDTARWASEYFWGTLYKPYPGEERMKPLVMERVEESLNHSLAGDQDALRAWIEGNLKNLSAHLPLVTGDSLLMFWVKGRINALHDHSRMRQILPFVFNSVDTKLENWRQAIRILGQMAPEQLNATDYKGQTPLMLTAQEGDTELVNIMLEAGADPDIQDYYGRTALYAAITSGVDSCVDALLDHPCRYDTQTHDGLSPLHTASLTANVHATRRLMQLSPKLAWQRNDQGMTPLERIEYLIENQEAFLVMAEELRRNGKRLATKEDMMDIIHLLEQAAPVP